MAITASIDEITAELWPGAPRSPAWRLASSSVALTVTEVGAHLLDVDLAANLPGARQPDHGATRPTRVTAGYDRSGDGWFGATVGRWANRIAGASFELDGTRHCVEANEGQNHLHGGPDGFHLRRWKPTSATVTDAGVAELRLVLESPDGDQGFPGRLRAEAIWRLAGDELTIIYQAETDAPTVINLTNHAYWNLGPDAALAVRADRVVETDDAGIPLATLTPVASTRFDVREPRPILDIVAEGGLDNCFVIGRLDEPLPPPTPPTPPTLPNEPHAVLRNERLRIEITTDQPGLQVYTGQHHRGIALEAQRLPDAPNRHDLGPAVLRAGEVYRSTTRIGFHAA